MTVWRVFRCCRRPLLVGVLPLLAGCALPVWEVNLSDTGGTGEGGTGGLFPPTGSGGAGGVLDCAGECKSKPAWFPYVSLFWIGPPEEAPAACPDVAPIEGSIGYADLHVAPHACPACSCSSAGCALPQAMHVSAAKCPAGGADSIAWDAAPGWEGDCSADNAIAPGLQCGGVPCVQSVTVAPAVVEPCLPSAQGVASIPAPSWGTVARECSLWPLTGDGCETGQACVPGTPPGYALCVFRDGDDPAVECPEEYPDRLVVAAGVADDRTCEPCTCGEPDGTCSALVAAFTDGMCGAPIGSVVVTSDEPACFDVPSGSGLASRSGALLVDKPGSCAPSGGAVGAIEPAGAMTLCCEPAGAPPR